jgi:hypothetical protein
VASFGRRGSDFAVKKDVPPAGHWSSTGCGGHAHDETQDCKIKEVKRVKKTSSTSTKAIEDIDNPDRTFRGRHPYASGVFTLEPALGVN